MPNYQLSLTTLEVTELLLSLHLMICHQHQWLTSVLWILLYCNWLSYATDCYSIFSQWSTNINVLPMTNHSWSTYGDPVRPQIATQSSHNDWPTSMFYQCPPNPTPLQLTELCRRLLLNILPMICQFPANMELGNHGVIIVKRGITWDFLGKLFGIYWGNTDVGQRLWDNWANIG